MDDRDKSRRARSIALGSAALVLAALTVVFRPVIPWPNAAFGFFFSLFLGAFVGPLTRWASSGWDTTSPLARSSGPIRETKRIPLITRDPSPGAFVLGVAEVALFYAALVGSSPEVIAGWLVFKTGAKWAAWQHIMQMPSRLDQVDEIDFVRFRHAFSSMIATSFMVGTAGNILAAAGGLLAASTLPSLL